VIKLFATILLLNIFLAILAPSITILYSDFFDEQIVFVNSEIENDTEEVEKEKKIIKYYSFDELPIVLEQENLIFNSTPNYLSINPKLFNPPPQNI